jgi:hypothetical protein
VCKLIADKFNHRSPVSGICDAMELKSALIAADRTLFFVSWLSVSTTGRGVLTCMNWKPLLSSAQKDFCFVDDSRFYDLQGECW